MNRNADYFIGMLRQLVTSGTLPPGHPLLACPLDPFASGTNLSEKRALRELRALAGERWCYELRRLYYGYISSGRRISSIHTGLVYLALYDDDLRELLRSHEAEGVFVLPKLQLWDEEAEARFYARHAS